MFAPFSSGYYVGRLVVEPHDGDTAFIQRRLHERVNEQLYATGRGIERLDYPLLMKLATKHFPVLGDEGVPEDTLVVPDGVVETDDLKPLPATREVLLAKPAVVDRLLEWMDESDDLVAT